MSLTVYHNACLLLPRSDTGTGTGTEALPVPAKCVKLSQCKGGKCRCKGWGLKKANLPL